MSFFSRPIHIGLSPNLSLGDVKRAFWMLIRPWKWKENIYVIQVEDWFINYFNRPHVHAVKSGRLALYMICKSLELPQGSEVLIQSFTCVAVPNSIRWAGCRPVYVDINKSLNLSLEDAEKKLTKKTKVLIVQHTFGIPADMEKTVEFCKKHDLLLIEDCAHALGATCRGKLLGTFGDFAFFSFGRDKIVSSVSGGLILVNTTKYRDKIEELVSHLKRPSVMFIASELLHPLISFASLFTYYVLDIGKVLLWLSQKLKILSIPVSKDELRGKKPVSLEGCYSNALAFMLLPQLENLEALNSRRRSIAHTYFKKLVDSDYVLPEKTNDGIYLRYNVLTKRADELRFRAKQRGIVLGNWYHNVIDPKRTHLETVNYTAGSCVKAEKAATESLNLPTYPNLTDAQVNTITDFLCNYK